MRGKDIDVDSFEWKQLKMPEKWFDVKSIKVSERGEMVMNAGLKKELQKDGKLMEINIEIADEFKLLKISSADSNGYRFPKNGRIKFLEFAEKLEQTGYSLPAIYNVEWNENAGVWIGVLDEVEKAPKVVRKRKTSEKRVIKV